ncbi:MAG: type II toxin-antitoxin system PemK/MazF family toxin [Candidatus Obscuribacterales bacterium]|nr:type II toxin-antitoxin system PemK/MazF family toxin [Candidatus Obscuribacterales bacterium]
MSSRKQKLEVAATQPVPRRGEIWMAQSNPVFPNDPHLPRPVLIISTDPRNRALKNVIVVPFSSGLAKPFPSFHKFVSKGEGGLPKDSFARCDYVSTMAKSCLNPNGPLGQPVSEKSLEEIVKGIQSAIGDNPLV